MKVENIFSHLFCFVLFCSFLFAIASYFHAGDNNSNCRKQTDCILNNSQFERNCLTSETWKLVSQPKCPMSELPFSEFVFPFRFCINKNDTAILKNIAPKKKTKSGVTNKEKDEVVVEENKMNLKHCKAREGYWSYFSN